MVKNLARRKASTTFDCQYCELKSLPDADGHLQKQCWRPQIMSERQACVVRDTKMLPENPGEFKVVGRVGRNMMKHDK